MDFLRKVKDGWMRFGRFMGNVVGRVILALFYFTIMLPFSLGVTLFGDPLKLKENLQEHWFARTTPGNSIEEARRQF